jgi:tetratricopeptide (TPR) repeat protein
LHDATRFILWEIAQGWIGVERDAEAVPFLRQHRELLLRTRGAHHPETLGGANVLARTLLALAPAELAEAEELAGDTYRVCRAELGPSQRLTWDAGDTWGVALRLLGRPEEARSILQAVLDDVTAAERDDAGAALFRIHHAECLADLGRREEAEAELRAALARAQGAGAQGAQAEVEARAALERLAAAD